MAGTDRVYSDQSMRQNKYQISPISLPSSPFPEDYSQSASQPDQDNLLNFPTIFFTAFHISLL